MVARARGDITAARRLHEECIALFREVGERAFMANALDNLAEALVAHGDTAGAESLYAEGLAIQWELRDRRGMVYSIIGLAQVAAEHGQWERAVRLHAAAATLTSALGMIRNPREQQTDADRLDSGRRQLGEEAFDGCWSEGQALPLDQAVAEALAGAPPA